VDFGYVLPLLVEAFNREGFRFAVIGGLAIAAYGQHRTTLDADFVVDLESQEAAIGLLEKLGYETLHRSSAYSNHLHPDLRMGRVDLMYVREETARELFAETQRRLLPRDVETLVAGPEHLAAMKAFAFASNPGRFHDLEDVLFLLKLEGVDRDRIRGQFEKRNLGERYRELEALL
jgi:hypothetical protein